MSTCKYCNMEITSDGDFCGNCGFVKFYEEEDAFKRLMKQFKYIFTNPVAFIRSSRLVNPIFTGVTAMMIILIELIIIKGMGRKLRLDIPAMNAILFTLGIVVTESLFMFGIVKGIFKKNVEFMAFINLTLSIQLISIIINIVGGILGVSIDPLAFTIVSVFGSIVSLLLMYQGIKDFVQADVIVHLVTIIGSLAGTSLVIFFVLKAMLKNALRYIF